MADKYYIPIYIYNFTDLNFNNRAIIKIITVETLCKGKQILRLNIRVLIIYILYLYNITIFCVKLLL